MAETRLRVSEMVSFHWRDGRLICDDPRRHRQLALQVEAERLLRTFADWTPLSAAGEATEVAVQLCELGILVAEGSPDDELERNLGAWRAMGGAATRYHLATRTRSGERFRSAADDNEVLRRKAGEAPPPDVFKDCPGELLPLPTGRPPGLSLADALERRRTVRHLDPERSLSLKELGILLDWTGGTRRRVTGNELGSVLMKASPSGGARHPIEIYCIVQNVEGLSPGIYHYSVRHHGLTRVGDPVPAEETVRWCGDQLYVGNAGVLFLYTAVLDRTVWKYPTGRAYRALHLDLGHTSQTAYLVATALDLGVFFTAATRDESVEAALGLDWTREIFLGVSGFGVPTEQERARLADMRTGGEAAFSTPRDAWDGRG